MVNIESLTKRFETVFTRPQATVLAQSIDDAYSQLVKTSDFNELKSIVRRLAEAQESTDAKIARLAEAQERMIDAQRHTDAALTELTQAVKGMSQELGGLSRSMSYALENDAYRLLPALLAAHYGIQLQERIVRKEIGGEEINFFARGERNGKPIYLVGETKLQLDERRNSRRAEEQILAQINKKVKAVAQAYPDVDIAPLLVTHYARPAMLQRAQEQNIIVIQSFEW
jgi:hypothetical protein